ncbi:hypothetical protein HDU87_001273 [Geranomyces variabilis]|uniref:CTLH domain-containing protein n=1 Tax=Geranomyces variabilis TaxID=109894 RepID=A0AAD5TGU7_9FUNG|nr:hypothetical protein HDU87_001273 [Geranomyces variabilis]
MVASVLPALNSPASTPHRPSQQALPVSAAASAPPSDPLAQIYNLLPAPVPTPGIHRYIHDHLVHNCFPLTARAFAVAAHLHAAHRPPAPAPAPPAPPAFLLSPPPPPPPPLIEEKEKEKEKEKKRKQQHEEPSQLKCSIGGMTMGQHTADDGDDDDDDDDDDHSVDDEDDDGDDNDATTDARKAVLDLVRAGNVAAAVEQCRAVYGDALLSGGGSDGGEEIRFQCACQMFVELVKVSAPRAMVFAQQELFGKYTSAGHMATLNDIIGLIAYPDPAASPLASYLGDARREDLAGRLNRRILESQGLASTSMIERLVRQSTVVRNTLQEVTEPSKEAKKPSKQPQAQARWDVSLLLGERLA